MNAKGYQLVISSGTLGAALLVGALSLAAPPLASGAQAHRTTHVAVPKGWASYTYSGATISVPKSWTAEHNSGCPLTTASGALLLGMPRVLMQCPSYPVSLGLVELYHPAPTGTESGQRIKVNGLPVVVIVAPGSTTSGSSTKGTSTVASGSSTSAYRQWSVPSLGIDITAQGSKALQILHTLRRS